MAFTPFEAVCNNRLVCDFPLVINTNLHPLTVSKLLPIVGQLVALTSCAFLKRTRPV